MANPRFSVIDNLGAVPPRAWNALAGNTNPFLRYEFLDTLERTGCVTPETGWIPQHMVAFSNENGTGELVAAVPLYLKSHSYGEYVFDWAWANAYARAGLDYYPKLVAAVPFTPATGPRLLVAPDAAELADAMIEAVLAHARQSQASSLHWLFTEDQLTTRLEDHGLMRRTGSQFHWYNRAYTDFDAFLAEFSAAKRKKIKRERRRVAEAGITLAVRTGTELSTSDWDTFFGFYRSTIRNHGAIPYLNRDFFHELGRRMPEAVLMTLAYAEGRPVAGALNLRGADTVYGRYWGSLDDYHSLHFETCYYSMIDYCIGNGIARFEAGAQGEHKLSRGFLPTTTYSAHWLRHPDFAGAVADFLAREQHGVSRYLEDLSTHSPFKQSS